VVADAGPRLMRSTGGVGAAAYARPVITPLTMSGADMETASDEDIVAAYMRDGLTRGEAEAYVAARSSNFIVD
jgi:hypothetical protein